MKVYGILELPGRLISLTEEDLVTAGKLVQFEGGRNDAIQAAAIVWTVAVRTGWMKYGSFTEMAYDFAQPINPRWREGGEFCGPGGRYEGTDHCSPERIARRAQAASIEWGALSPVAQATATAFVKGQLRNPVPGAVDFASGSTAEAGERRSDLIALYERAGQVYFAAKRQGDDSRTLAWRAVRVRPKGLLGVLTSVSRAFL